MMAARWSSCRGLETLLGIGLLVASSKIDGALQFTQVMSEALACVAVPATATAAAGGDVAGEQQRRMPQVSCAVIDDPLLSKPVWWFDETGTRTPERECTPRRLRACLAAKGDNSQLMGGGTYPQIEGWELVAADTDWCCLALADDREAHLPQMRVYKSLAIHGIFFPAAACFLASVARSRDWWPLDVPQPPRRDLYIGLLWSHVFANVPVIITKALVGRPRPIYIALMLWAEHQRGLSDEQREALRLESVRSFPSGHASMSAAGCCYVSLVMLELISASLLARQQRPSWLTALPVARTLCVVLVVWLPALLAVWVCITRLQDYWHHYGDVIAGYLLGGGGAWLSFHFVTPRPDTSTDVAAARGSAGALETGAVIETGTKKAKQT